MSRENHLSPALSSRRGEGVGHAARLLIVHNRQRARPLNTKFLRTIVRALLIEEVRQDDFEIGISIVGEGAMTRMNEGYLRHKGSTDVITFSYADAGRPKCLTGEIFVCLDEALAQGPRFRVSWQNELVRYIVHGILHLSGYDDKSAVARRKMKREENRLMRRLAERFKLDQINVAPRRTIAAK
jgi:probable rRNA maturation factor